jgi:hypothetical protein
MRGLYKKAKLPQMTVKGESMGHVEMLHKQFACTIGETPNLIMILPEYSQARGMSRRHR